MQNIDEPIINEELKEEDIIAKKSIGAAILYLIGTVICIGGLCFFIALGNSDKNAFYYFLLGIGAVIMLILFIYIISLPNNLIIKNGKFLNIFNGGWQTIALSEIKDVKNYNSRGKGFSYSFGKIVIFTNEKDYTIWYISEVESVRDTIMKLIHSRKK
jgi:hypothetical protein